ncbi:MAG: hypothetical protein IT319_19315 [Anaerolineae bacterium]|nr:hypothetical protein [Anaerolineae bacterium]
MNDQLSGQLGWAIPAYARDLLWLTSESGAAKLEGARGLFTLDAPAPVLTLRWGGADGPALAQLRWQADSLDWDGVVRVGGYIDALHITELDDLPAPVTILHVGGQPLKPGVSAFPGRAARRAVPYPVPSFFDGIADDVDETVTTWMALEDSPTLTLAQDALVSKLPVYCFGRLAEQDAGWHDLFALPIALEGMTLFAP